MPRLGESRLTGFSFKQYQPSYRPLQPKKTRASHNLSPAWGINWAKREGGRVLNVGHMQMTNSSTLEESCLAPSGIGSARLSTASWRRSQPTMRANRGAHPARCFATVSGRLSSQSINNLLVASSCFRVVWDAISMRRAIAVAMAPATHNVGGIRPRDTRSRFTRLSLTAI